MLRFTIYLVSVSVILLLVMNLVSSAVLLRDSLIAAGMSAANAFAGYYLAVSGARKAEHRAFIKTVYGGMALRVLSLVILTVLLIRMEWVEAIPFFLMLMGFYVLHQILELTALNRRIKSGLNPSQERKV